MIRMFVGDDDAVEAIYIASDRGQAPKRFFFAEPRVDKQPGLVRLEQGAVARTARPQNRYAQIDNYPRRTSASAQAHRIMTKRSAPVNNPSRSNGEAFGLFVLALAKD